MSLCARACVRVFVWLGMLCVLSIETLHYPPAVHVWRVNLKIRWTDSRRFMEGEKEMKKKLRMEKKQTHDGRERCIMRGEGERNEDQVWIRRKSEMETSKWTERESLRHSEISCCDMHAQYIYSRSLRGRVLSLFLWGCDEFAQLIKVWATVCSWIQDTYAHTHTDTHCAPPLASYHYPSLHPPFGISRPDRSWPITLSLCRPAYLSLSHPPLSLSRYLSFSHHISSLPVSTPSHNSLLPTNCINFKIT